MIEFIKILTMSLLWFYGGTTLLSQLPPLAEVYSIADGLPDNLVESFCIDDRGFAWVGSHYGLSRFDGNQFLNYLPKKNGLEHTHIMRIEQLNSDTLLVLSNFCLYFFSMSDEYFYPTALCLEDSLSMVTEFSHLRLDNDSIAWIGGRGGLYKYHIKQDSYEHGILDTTAKSSLEHFNFNYAATTFILESYPSTIFVGGRYLWAVDKTTLEVLWQDTFTIFANETVATNSDEIWIVGWGYLGLVKYQPSTHSYQIYAPEPSRTLIMEAVDQLNDSILVIGTRGDGLVGFNLKNETFIYSQPVKKKDQSDLDIALDLYIDKEGRIWHLTYGGIRLYDPNANVLKTYKYTHEIPRNGIYYDKVIQGAYPINDSLCFINSYADYGQHIFNRSTEEFSTISTQHLASSFQSSSGDIWLGQTYLQIYDHNLGRILPVNKRQFLDDFPSVYIRDISEDHAGNLWLATNRNGVIKYDTTNKRFTQYLSETTGTNQLDARSVIVKIFFDRQHRMYASTDMYGTYVLDMKVDTFEQRIWPITNEGDSLFSRFETYLVDAKGRILASNDIQLIWLDRYGEVIGELKDEDGNSIGNSIEAYSTTGNKVVVLTQTHLYCFDSDSDIVQWSLTEDNGLKDLMGWDTYFRVLAGDQIFIGKKNGSFHLFNLSDIDLNSNVPRLAFSSLNILSDTASTTILIEHQRIIELPYYENNLTFNFASLNYTHPQKNRFKYRITGLHDHWIENGTNSSVTFASVVPGRYEMEFIGSNNSNVWNEQPKSIGIVIYPPWWKTKLAYLLYTIFISAVGYTIFTNRSTQLKLRNSLARETQERLQMEKVERIKNKIYTNITHEFRTPLTVISGMADQMQDESIKRKLIKRNANNLLDLVNQMLDLSKIDSGQLQPELVQMDLVPQIEYLVENYLHLAHQQNIKFQSKLLVDTLWLDMDPVMFERILNNLVHNAIKFTPNGGQVSLRVVSHVEQPQCQIRIKDTGRGIATEHLDKIFDRFYQVDASTTRHGEGTGIGLALVKELTELLHGQINVKSELHEGTTFDVTFPITKEAPLVQWHPTITTFTQPTEVSTTSKPLGPSNAPTILVVEDHTDLRHYLRSLLMDYDLLEADNGRHALSLAYQEIPDLIISDIMMPEMDGFELCQNIKTDQRTSHIPVILLTAKSSQDDRLEGLKGGADAYLTKPFDKRELFIRIEKLLESRIRLQHHYQQFQMLPKEAVEENKFLDRIRTIIESNLNNEQFQIEDLANEIHLSRTQVYRKLKALTGKTFTAILKEMRIHRAQELLTKTDKTIGAIAFELGFRDQSYFTKVFKEVAGKPPKEMRS